MVRRNDIDYCTAEEAAKILHISRSRVYHLKNKLTHIKQGKNKQGRVLFRVDRLLDDYLTCDRFE